jgi:hypothetical protein
VVAVLLLLGAAFGLAALPVLRRAKLQSAGPIAPHPSRPGSMITFVTLPCLLILLTLCRLGLLVRPEDPVNGPESSRRWSDAPEEVDVDVVADPSGGTPRFTYPRNTAELVVMAAARFESPSRWERLQGVRDLAWWTSVCPNYAPFTLPRLTRALKDPDPGMKGAAAIGLGSTGGNSAAVIPDLLAARGTTVRYFDHVAAEAVSSIERAPRWPPAPECEAARASELEARAAQRRDAADRVALR